MCLRCWKREAIGSCTANLRNHCGVRRISGNLPGGGRRVTVAPQHRKESSGDTVRRCTQNTLMLPCGSKTVDHAFDIDGHALPASSHRWSGGAVPIRVFCVHHLPASALRFLLCGAADRCWRTHCQARVGAHASGATPWRGACMAPRFGCGQRLRCVLCVHRLSASALRVFLGRPLPLRA